jgi:hypothetical protein
MDNSTLLYIGMFCFAMMGIGMGLTVYEFKKLSPSTKKTSHDAAKPKASPSLRSANLVELP